MEVIQVQPDQKKNDILGVLARNLPEASGSARFDWLYLDNPDGKALVWMMINDEGEPVGTSAAIPRQIVVNDKVVRGVILSDFAIDDAYRSLGPALKLQRATLAAVLQGEFKLSLDYPSKSMQAIYSRLGTPELGAEHRYVKLLSVSDKVKERIGRGLLSVVITRCLDFAIRIRDVVSPSGAKNVSVATHDGAFGGVFSVLSRSSLASRKVFIDRHEAYLGWRFGAHPERNYVTLTAIRSGRLVGYLIFDRMGDNTVSIDELILDSSDERVGFALLDAVTGLAKAENRTRVQCAVLENSPLEGILSRSSFSRRESGIGPYAVMRDDDGEKSAVMDNKYWWLGAGDRDG